jgi:hypothetical protein
MIPTGFAYPAPILSSIFNSADFTQAPDKISKKTSGNYVVKGDAKVKELTLLKSVKISGTFRTPPQSIAKIGFTSFANTSYAFVPETLRGSWFAINQIIVVQLSATMTYDVLSPSLAEVVFTNLPYFPNPDPNYLRQPLGGSIYVTRTTDPFANQAFQYAPIAIQGNAALAMDFPNRQTQRDFAHPGPVRISLNIFYHFTP